MLTRFLALAAMLPALVFWVFGVYLAVSRASLFTSNNPTGIPLPLQQVFRAAAHIVLLLIAPIMLSGYIMTTIPQFGFYAEYLGSFLALFHQLALLVDILLNLALICFVGNSCSNPPAVLVLTQGGMWRASRLWTDRPVNKWYDPDCLAVPH